MRLSQVQKDLAKRDLVNQSQLLEQLRFDGGCAGAPVGSKAMQAVMEINGAFKPHIQDGGDKLPNDLQETDAPAATMALWEEDRG
jgi:hypothetical protein